MLKSIDGPTEAAGVSDGEFKDCLAVKYILFAAFRMSLGEAWLQTDCGGRVTAVLLNKNDGTIICPSSSADLRELSEFASFFGENIYFCSGNDCADAKAVLMELSELPQKETCAQPLCDITADEYKVLTGKTPDSDDRAYLEWLSRTGRGVFGRSTRVMCIRQNGKTASLAVGDIIGKDAYIRDVATSENYRGRGFAADCVISLSRELKKSADCIFLMCKPDNAKLYEKCGFRKKEYIIRKT